LSLYDEMKSLSLKVDDYLSTYFRKEPQFLYDASYYLIRHGGKRQRPFILINSGMMFGASLEGLLPAAAAIEILHNFTLVHDDIMDNDEERRGVPTVHVKFGVPMAILAGDLLFAKSFEAALNLLKNSYTHKQVVEVVKALVTASIEVCEGQALDLKIAESKDFPSKEEYYNLIELKTSSLFKACTTIGSVLGGADEPSIEMLKEFGRLYGLCFQLVDDVLAVTGDPSITGKPVGNDIREGKKTLVIKYVLDSVSERDRSKLLSIIGNRKASNEEINEALSIIASSGAPERVRLEAKLISEKAISILQNFPKSRARDMLINLTMEASSRSR
jgi:geranylgeranyl diphosphate synthase type I